MVAVARQGDKSRAQVDHATATVIALSTGGVLSTHHINPDQTAWRNQ